MILKWLKRLWAYANAPVVDRPFILPSKCKCKCKTCGKEK